MKPFHVDRVRMENGVWTWDAFAQEWFLLRSYFVMVLADLVARAKAARLIGHHGESPAESEILVANLFLGATGRHGCHVCMMRGLTYAAGQGTHHFPHVTPADLAAERDRVPYNVHAADFPPTRDGPTLAESSITYSGFRQQLKEKADTHQKYGDVDRACRAMESS